ncbi:MAG: LysR substrate-binding domain-containing protein [Endozoicomonas sp.]
MATCTLTDVPSAIHGRGAQDRFVCVLRKSHPLAATGLDLVQYVRYPHALITMGGERKGTIDHFLERHGLSRRIALRVPHFVAALALVAGTDLLLTVPYGLVKSCASHYGLVILPFPMAQKASTYSVIWHERYLREPRHQWLRQLIVGVNQGGGDVGTGMPGVDR